MSPPQKGRYVMWQHSSRVLLGSPREDEVDAEWALHLGARSEFEGDNARGVGVDGHAIDPLSEGAVCPRIGQLDFAEGVARVVGESGFHDVAAGGRALDVEQDRSGAICCGATGRQLEAMLLQAARGRRQLGRIGCGPTG